MSVRLLLLLGLINSSGIRGGRLVISLYALHLGADPVMVGVLAATFAAVPAALAWPAGRMADRFGARWMMVLGAATAGLGMLLPYFLPSMTILFVTAAMNGFSLAIYMVSVQNLIGLVSTAEQRAQNFSNFALAMSLSNFCGPLVAGLAIDNIGFSLAFVCISVLACGPIPLVLGAGRNMPGGTHKARDKKGGGVREMLASRSVRKTLAISSLQQAGQDLFLFYMPIYGHDIGMSASAIGIILAANAAAAFGVRMFLQRLIAWLGEERIITYSFVLGSASFLLVPFFQNVVILALISLVFGLGSSAAQPIITTLMFSNSADGRSGESLGLRLAVNQLTRVVGPVAFGFIGSTFGLFPVFWINAIMLASGAAIGRSGIMPSKNTG